MRKTPQSTLEEREKQRSVSRRELMKIIGAMGSTLTVTALLPDKWLPPDIAVGVLPAHAQTSDGLMIDSLQINPVGAGVGSEGPLAGNGGLHYQASMQYHDPLQKTAVDGHSQVLGKYPGPSGSDVMCTILNVGPPFALSGTVWFSFTISSLTNSTEFCTRLQCDSPYLRTSNQLCGSLPVT